MTQSEEKRTIFFLSSCHRDLVTVPPSLTSTHSEKPVDVPSLPTEPSPVPTKGVPPLPTASAKPGETKVPPTGLPTTPKGKSRRRGGGWERENTVQSLSRSKSPRLLCRFPEDFEMDLTMERSGR